MTREIDPDYADYLYDQMRDDFLMIENEAGAIACLIRYASVAAHYMPKQYRYLLRSSNDTINKRNKNS